MANIYTLPLLLPSPPPPPLHDPGSDYDLIIDNGSTTFRWGFAHHEPRTAPNVVAKYKERRNNKSLLLFGEAVDCETGARGQARSPWEGDVLLNFEALVCCLRHLTAPIHGWLGKRAGLCLYPAGDRHTHRRPSCLYDGACRHAPSLPCSYVSPSRTLQCSYPLLVTSELLFELYSIPQVTYCIDGIMSFYNDNGSAMPFTADGLVVSFNTASTSVIPVLNGKGILSHAKRYHLLTSTVVCLSSSSCPGFHGEHLRPLSTSSNLFN